MSALYLMANKHVKKIGDSQAHNAFCLVVGKMLNKMRMVIRGLVGSQMCCI